MATILKKSYSCGLRSLNLKSQLSSLYSVRDHGVHTNRRTWLNRLGYIERNIKVHCS